MEEVLGTGPLGSRTRVTIDSKIAGRIFARLALEHGAGVIVVSYDQPSLDVFEAIYEVEEGQIQRAPGDLADKQKNNGSGSFAGLDRWRFAPLAPLG